MVWISLFDALPTRPHRVSLLPSKCCEATDPDSARIIICVSTAFNIQITDRDI